MNSSYLRVRDRKIKAESLRNKNYSRQIDKDGKSLPAETKCRPLKILIDAGQDSLTGVPERIGSCTIGMGSRSHVVSRASGLPCVCGNIISQDGEVSQHLETLGALCGILNRYNEHRPTDFTTFIRHHRRTMVPSTSSNEADKTESPLANNIFDAAAIGPHAPFPTWPSVP